MINVLLLLTRTSIMFRQQRYYVDSSNKWSIRTLLIFLLHRPLFLGQFGPAIALIAASYTGCDPYLTVAILTVGVGLNGAIYSGFKVNHLDISPRFAGILMSLTNCLANLAGLLAPIVAGYVIDKRVSEKSYFVKIMAGERESVAYNVITCINLSLKPFKLFQWLAYLNIMFSVRLVFFFIEFELIGN